MRDAELTINGSVLPVPAMKSTIWWMVLLLISMQRMGNKLIRISGTEKAVAAVTAFIEQYNSVNEFIRKS